MPTVKCTIDPDKAPKKRVSKRASAKTSKTVKRLVKRVSKKVSKRASKKASNAADCEDGTILNPATGKCIKDTAANRKRLGLESPVVVTKTKTVKQAKKVVAKTVKTVAADTAKYSKMTVAQLKEICEDFALPKGGLKADIIARLIEHDLESHRPPNGKPVKKYPKKVAAVVEVEAEAEPESVVDLGEESETEEPEPEPVPKKKMVKRLVKKVVRRAKTVVAAAEAADEGTAADAAIDANASCRTDPCTDGQVCNVDTGDCRTIDDLDSNADVKNHWMLEINGNVYYGTKATLSNFASEIGVENPTLQVATKNRMKQQVSKQAKAPAKKVPVQAPKQPSPTVPEPEAELDIVDVLAEESEEPKQPPSEVRVLPSAEPAPPPVVVAAKADESPDDIQQMQVIMKDITVDDQLTPGQQRLVEKIRECLGI